MNQNEQDAVIGRAHREAEQNRYRMRALKKEAFDLGTELEKAGQALKQMPEYADIFGFSDEHYSLVQERLQITVERTIFDAEKITRLLQDLRSTKKLIDNASEVL